MAFRMAMYNVQTLILVFREALATGAGSEVPLVPSECVDGGVINGKIVDRASGSRRVRNSVDDWRYVLEMEEAEAGRAEVDEAREAMEEEIALEDEKRSVAVGLNVAVYDPLVGEAAIV